MRQRTFIMNARITALVVAALSLAIFMAFALAACDSRTPAVTDIPPTSPETIPPTISPEPVSPPLSESEIVEIDLAEMGVTDEQLAQMIANGEIPADVTHLLLWGNQISDISPLSGLTNLRVLTVAGNQINDLTPLSGLTNLLDLGIASNPISDITPLRELTNLTDLHMLGTQVSDTSPLRGMINLKTLYISDGPIIDVEPLRGLVNLTFLYLRADSINDLTPLHELTNLTHLQLDITMTQHELDSLIAALPNCVIMYEYSVITSALSDLLIIDEFDPFNSGGAVLNLGMSFSGIFDRVLETGHLDIDTSWGTDFESSIDNGTHHTWDSNLAGATADKDNITYILLVIEGSSKAGLRHGDPIERVIELYGDADNTYTYDEITTLLEWDMRGYFFRVEMSEGYVRLWGVSVYSQEFFNNHPALT